MADNYVAGMDRFLTDPVKRELAVAKLAAVYLTMIRRNIPARYKEIYTELRNMYYPTVRRIYEEALGPAV